MGAKSKSGNTRAVSPKGAAKPTGRRGRRPATPSEAWEQIAQVPDEREDELDCQRIVQGDGCRSLPLYYDDYN